MFPYVNSLTFLSFAALGACLAFGTYEKYFRNKNKKTSATNYPTHIKGDLGSSQNPENKIITPVNLTSSSSASPSQTDSNYIASGLYGDKHK